METGNIICSFVFTDVTVGLSFMGQGQRLWEKEQIILFHSLQIQI